MPCRQLSDNLRLSPRRSPINVAVAGEPELVVRGLQSLLQPFDERVRLLGPHPAPSDPDVLLHDSLELDAGALARVEAFGRARRIHLVEFSWRTDSDLVRRARRRGAAGYVHKGATGPDLVHSLERVAAGHWTAPSPDSGAPRPDPVLSVLSSDLGLSCRELQMLTHIASGLTNRDIAAQCFLSINSVKTYIRTAYRKIGVSRRSQAVLWAIEHQLIDVLAETS